MAISGGDFDFPSTSIGSYSSPVDASSYNTTGSDSSVVDEQARKNQMALSSGGQFGTNLFSPSNSYSWSSGDPWNRSGQQMGSGAEAIDNFFANGGYNAATDPYAQLGFFTSGNGTQLQAMDPKLFGDTSGQYKYFADTFQDPTKSSEHDKADVTYRYDPATGQSVPISASQRYQAGDWVDTYRPLLQTAAPVVLAGLGGAYFGGGEAAAGAGAGDITTSGYAAGANDFAGLGSEFGGYGAGSAYTPVSLEGGFLPTAEEAAAFGGTGTSAFGPEAAAQLNALNTGGFSLGDLAYNAGKGSLTGAGTNAAQGKNPWEGAVAGAIGGGLGYGVGQYNPGGYFTGNTDLQSIINRGTGSAIGAGLSGGNPLTSAAYGGALQGGNVLGNNLLGSTGTFLSPEEAAIGGNMPDNSLGGNSPYFQQDFLGGGSPNVGTSSFYSTPYDQAGAGQVVPAGAQSQAIDQELGGGSQNPFLSYAAKALGLGGGTGGMKFGDMAGNLAGLYAAYQQKKKLGGLASNLNDMFSPNSAYAQQLQQQLARRDAAAGRRSQYGPREVELQAKLAEMNARNAPTLQNIYGAQGQAGNAMYNNALQLGRNSGLTDYLGSQASTYLNSLFGG